MALETNQHENPICLLGKLPGGRPSVRYALGCERAVMTL
jgi:hypothetical protein